MPRNAGKKRANSSNGSEPCQQYNFDYFFLNYAKQTNMAATIQIKKLKKILIKNLLAIVTNNTQKLIFS